MSGVKVKDSNSTLLPLVDVGVEFTLNYRKRLLYEIKNLQNNEKLLKQNNIYFQINDDSMNVINVMMIGCTETPYQGGFYFFRVSLCNNQFPTKPPEV